jgi:hypothetical protein
LFSLIPAGEKGVKMPAWMHKMMAEKAGKAGKKSKSRGKMIKTAMIKRLAKA